jgi:hypothetical protein
VAYPSLYHRLVANTTEPENGQACWTWTAKRDRWGYGRFNVRAADGRVVVKMAHIEMLRHFEPIDPKLQVDHTCYNPSCVNPDHLEQVTPKVNMQRRTAAAARSRHA